MAVSSSCALVVSALFSARKTFKIASKLSISLQSKKEEEKEEKEKVIIIMQMQRNINN
jgi:hypothetical protein